MGVFERKEREKTEKKQLILDAARKLFLEQGFEKTSIRTIADAIEYSPSTLYLYYKDKNELFYDLHCEAFEKLIEFLQEIPPLPDPFDRLIATGRSYLKFGDTNPELYDLMFVLQAPMETIECREEVWSDGKSAFALLVMLVDDCKKVGYFQEKNSTDVSLMIWSFVHGLLTLKNRQRLKIFDDRQHERQEQAFLIFSELLKKV